LHFSKSAAPPSTTPAAALVCSSFSTRFASSFRGRAEGEAAMPSSTARMRP